MQRTIVYASKWLLITLIATAGVSGAGCSRNPASIEQREEQDPYIRRARARKNAQDIDGAIDLFKRALERKPRLARAHLELGLLYDEYREDYTRALYHYQRYLEMRPDTEKRKMIEDLVRHARISFAATLPETPSGAIEEIAELKRENDALRNRLTELATQIRDIEAARKDESERAAQAMREVASLKTQASQVPGDAPAPHARPVARPETKPRPTLVEPKPAPAQQPVQTYRVQRGDNLSSIAAKMYDDSSQWTKIYEANRNSLERPESLRVGQTLIIPR
jgi:tetratricopeptide (TPR) repeat protein